MTITADPFAVAIATFNAVPLSMGDCFIKITPEQFQTIYEVRGHFIGFDSTSPVAISGSLRDAAEKYLDSVVTLCGGVHALKQIEGPLGSRFVPVAGAVAHDLFNPFSGATYAGVYLVGVSSDDSGGKHFGVTYTFSKPLSVASDGTAASMVLFNSTQIGNRGGTATVSADGSVFKISATSEYVWGGGDPLPLTYIATLCNTLGLNQSFVTPLPRGAASSRAAIRSYSSTVGIFEWSTRGTISQAVLDSMNASESTPGVLSIQTTFTAVR